MGGRSQASSKEPALSSPVLRLLTTSDPSAAIFALTLRPRSEDLLVDSLRLMIAYGLRRKKEINKEKKV